MLRKIQIFLVFVLVVILPTASVYYFGFWKTLGALVIFTIMQYLFQEGLEQSEKKAKAERKG